MIQKTKFLWLFGIFIFLRKMDSQMGIVGNMGMKIVKDMVVPKITGFVKEKA